MPLPLRHLYPHPHPHLQAKQVAFHADTPEASIPSPSPSPSPAGGEPKQLRLYAFTIGRMAFIALDAAHTLGKGTAQQVAMQRAAAASRAAGAEWVVAYGVAPANASLEELHAALVSADSVVDVFIYSPSASQSRPRAVHAGVHAGLRDRRHSIRAVQLAGTRSVDEGYARLRPNRTALLVEHIRASDGLVLDAFAVPGAPRKSSVV